MKNKKKNIMKKNLLVFSLIFAMFSTFAQEVKTENKNDNAAVADSVATSSFCPNRINIELGEAFTNNIYKRVGLKWNHYPSLNSMVNISYAYFFNEHWGLSLGVGANCTYARTSISMEGIQEDYPDPDFAPGRDIGYDLVYKTSGLIENQMVWAVEVPLKAQFECKFGNGRNGIYAGLGVSGYFPFMSYNKFLGKGNVKSSGREDLYNADYQGMDNHFPEKSYEGKGKNVKLRCSVGLDADFGGVFAMGPKADFYLGAFVKYYFLDILPKEKVPLMVRNAQNIPTFTGTLGSDMLTDMKQKHEEYKDISEKWFPLHVGLKIGFHLKTCANPVEKSRKQLEKEILDELKKKVNEPIIIKQDPQYIYIVPVCEQLEEDENGLTAEDRENIRELAEALSNTKIKFDLDKDEPKIDESSSHISKTVEVLNRDPSLKLIIEGYTCDLGSEKYNRELAQRRAEKVKALFIQRGVRAGQIETASYTSKDPQNKQNIKDPRREEHRAVIFRIVKG